MHRHALSEGGHLLRKCLTSLRAQPIAPLAEDRLCARIETMDAALIQSTRELEWRETRAMQDFIRVRVPDPIEEAGIGERPLDRMALGPQARRKFLRGDFE